MNFRAPLILVLSAVVFASAPPARAGLSGMPAAVCGGVMLTTDMIEKRVAGIVNPKEFAPLFLPETDLAGFAKSLDAIDGKDAETARKRIANHLARSTEPGMRTTAMLFTGEDASLFLKTSAEKAGEIADQARKNKIFSKTALVLFGVRTTFSVAGLVNLMSMDEPDWGYALPAFYCALTFGKPLALALLRMKKSPLEKFIAEEFSNLGTKANREINTLSVSTQKVSGLETLVSVQENARAPWARRLAVTNGVIGYSRIMRAVEKKNPLVLPKTKVHMDLIAMPGGANGERRLLVLTSEGPEVSF